MHKIFLFFLFLFISLYSYAQTSKEFIYYSEFGTSLGKGLHTPFWLISNKHGASSDEMPSAYLRAALFKSLDSSKLFTYRWGADIIGGLNCQSPFYIQQLYFSLKYGAFLLDIGSVERDPELRNALVSSGSLTLSNNARPIPQVRISIPNYMSVPFTNDWLHIRGHLAYGLFVDNRFQEDHTRYYPLITYATQGKYVKNAIYHSKSLYVKIGNAKYFPLSMEGGLEMGARFGGKCYLNDGTNFKAPSNIKDFIKILVPLKGGNDSPIMDQQNVLGDHLGSWNFAINYQYKDWLFRLYYEHQFNDHSQMFGEYSWRDGFWGIELNLPQNRILDCLVFERIDSRDQTGPIYHDSDEQIPEQISAVDDYYNHGIYSGWQHVGMSIANPFFVSPLYNTNSRLSFTSNRLVANHIGILGMPFEWLKYRILLSHTDHWGTYTHPFHKIKYNRNYLVEFSFIPLRNPSWLLIAALGIDKSDIIGNNWGLSFTLRKDGLLKIK